VKHAQRPDKSKMVCQNCRKGECGGCVDILRIVYSEEPICTCERKEHSGEASAKQVKDPFDGSVYGPHSVIKEDGTVVTDEEFLQLWREQFGDR
jgi:hypothetical protein